MFFKFKFVLAAGAIAAGILFESGGSCPYALDDSKQIELEQKIADLTLLYHQFQNRMQQAQRLRDALADQEEALTAEIHGLLKKQHIESLHQKYGRLFVRRVAESSNSGMLLLRSPAMAVILTPIRCVASVPSG